MIKLLFSLFILIFFESCVSNQLYILNTFDSDWPWETIAISRAQHKNVQMLQLFRNDTSIESRLTEFQEIAKNHYSSNDAQQQIEFHKGLSILHRDNQNFTLPKIKNSPKKSTKRMVEEILEDNYIVHANIHQITYFDCRKDSFCYQIKLGDQMPYDTNTWYLVSLKNELFLSYRNSRGFLRVFADHGRLEFTYTMGIDQINVYNADLKSKK